MLLEEARRRAGQGEWPHWVQADHCELPFADGSFDAVVSRIAPHHFTDIRAAVTEMARVAADRVLVVDNLYLGDWKAAVSSKLESLGAIDTTVRESLALSWRRMLDVVSLAGWTFLMVAYIVLLVVRL